MVEAVEIPEGYKKTEVGVIPGDWEVKKLSEISNFENGKAHEQFVDDKGDFIVVNSKFISTKGKIIKFSNRNLCPLQKRNIVFVMSDIPNGKALAKCFLIDKDNHYALNQRIGCIIANEGIDNEYLFYKLNRNKYFLSFDSGTGQTNLKKNEIQDCPVPLPPTKAEQSAIATALNDADALISQLEKLIAKKRNIKQGAMQELLKQKEGWEKKKLGEIADINMGQSPDSKHYNLNGEGMPLIQGNADIKNRKSIRRVWTKQIIKTCKQGDLIMTVRAPVGAIGIASENSCIGRGVCSFKVTGVDKKFLCHLLISKETDWKILEQGSTFTSANSNQIFSFELSIPKEKPEQTRIAQILSDMDAEIEELEKKMQKYQQIKQGMMQNLLTGKIRLA